MQEYTDCQIRAYHVSILKADLRRRARTTHNPAFTAPVAACPEEDDRVPRADGGAHQCDELAHAHKGDAGLELHVWRRARRRQRWGRWRRRRRGGMRVGWWGRTLRWWERLPAPLHRLGGPLVLVQRIGAASLCRAFEILRLTKGTAYLIWPLHLTLNT